MHGRIADVTLHEAWLASDLPAARRAAAAIVAAKPESAILHLPPGRIETRAAVLLDALATELERQSLKIRIVPGSPEQERFLTSFRAASPGPRPAPRRTLIEIIAAHQQQTIDSVLRYLDIFRRALAQLVLGLLLRVRWRGDDFLASTLRMGRDAVPLVGLISMLIGAILALQAGPFFARFGQEILVPQLVAMSMLREIGPLLTAVLVAGRSGSSLAAEIGTMRVAEEIDALEVMGADPVRVLVTPRLVAMGVALPCLVVIADVVGVLGGMIVGSVFLNVPAVAYLSETQKALKLSDVVGGLAKAVAFALVIVTVAAHQGFATTGGATGVGRRTTKSVVLAILWIIIVDGFFTWLLYRMDL